MFLLFVSGGLCALLGYNVLLVIYRLYFHPLAKFPGPKIAAATKWYECWHDVLVGEGGQYAWKIQEMHQKYGPIVRINPDELHVLDSKYLDTIYAPFPARRDKWAPAAGMVGSPLGSFGTVDHQLHRKRRAANSVLFTTKTVAAAGDTIYSHVEALCDDMSEARRSGQVLKIQIPLLAFTTDLMTRWVLGKPLGCQEDQQLAEKWEETTQCLPAVTPIVKQFPWLISLALKIPTSLIHLLLPSIGAVADLHKRMFAEARQHAGRPTSASDHKENASSNSKLTVFDAIDMSDLPFSEKAVQRKSQEAFTIVSAGTETTARVIAGCLFQLVEHPDSLARVRAELLGVMPDSKDQPEIKLLEKLPYLTAVLKENLRAMQRATSRFPLQPYEELRYEDWFIPAKTPISMTMSEILLDPAIFPEPKRFQPERWLSADGTLKEIHHPYFVPFGRGTRACVGQNVAWAIMYICVAKIVRRFDLSLHETTRARDFTVSRDCFLGVPSRESKGIRMMVTKDYASEV